MIPPTVGPIKALKFQRYEGFLENQNIAKTFCVLTYVFRQYPVTNYNITLLLKSCLTGCTSNEVLCNHIFT